jgi:hypothetical protein
MGWPDGRDRSVLGVGKQMFSHNCDERKKVSHRGCDESDKHRVFQMKSRTYSTRLPESVPD